AHEIAAVQIIANPRGIAAEERIAILSVGRTAVCRQEANIAAQAHMAAEVILHAAPNTIGKCRAIRGCAHRGAPTGGHTAVGIMGEAQAGGNVGAQFMLAPEKDIESAKLEL